MINVKFEGKTKLSEKEMSDEINHLEVVLGSKKDHFIQHDGEFTVYTDIPKGNSERYSFTMDKVGNFFINLGFPEGDKPDQ